MPEHAANVTGGFHAAVSGVTRDRSFKNRSDLMARRVGSGWPMLDLMLATQKMWLDSADTILKRSMMMAAGSMSQAEAMRMVAEKPLAMAEASMRASMAAARGADATGIARAAMRPVASKARANSRRLK